MEDILLKFYRFIYHKIIHIDGIKDIFQKMVTYESFKT